MSPTSLPRGLLLWDITPEQTSQSTGLSQVVTTANLHEGLLRLGPHRKLLGTEAAHSCHGISAKYQCADSKLSWITAGCWVSSQCFREPVLQDRQHAQTSSTGQEPSSSSLSMQEWGCRGVKSDSSSLHPCDQQVCDFSPSGQGIVSQEKLFHSELLCQVSCPPPSTYTLLTIPVPIIIWGKPARTGSKVESGIEGDFNSWRNWNQFKHNCTRVFTTEMRNRKLGELKGSAPTSDAWRTLKNAENGCGRVARMSLLLSRFIWTSARYASKQYRFWKRSLPY